MLQVISGVQYKADHEAKVGYQLEPNNPFLNITPLYFYQSFDRVITEDLKSVGFCKFFIDQVDYIAVAVYTFTQVDHLEI